MTSYSQKTIKTKVDKLPHACKQPIDPPSRNWQKIELENIIIFEPLPGAHGLSDCSGLQQATDICAQMSQLQEEPLDRYTGPRDCKEVLGHVGNDGELLCMILKEYVQLLIPWSDVISRLDSPSTTEVVFQDPYLLHAPASDIVPIHSSASPEHIRLCLYQSQPEMKGKMSWQL